MPSILLLTATVLEITVLELKVLDPVTLASSPENCEVPSLAWQRWAIFILIF